MSKKIEYGDFQTPISLAKKSVNLVSQFIKPDFVLEPTCGVGYFLEASFEKWRKVSKYKGYEINNSYIAKFNKRCPDIKKFISVEHANFFSLNFELLLKQSKTPLVIGNPPWVTNSGLGVLNSTNLPKKINTEGLSGFNALTGKSNFDISEWMIIQLNQLVQKKRGLLGMLCKTSVARNIFLRNFKNNHKNVSYKIFKINAQKEFGVSVDACLFVCDYFNGGDEFTCDIYNDLSLSSFQSRIGINSGNIIANIDLHKETKPLINGKAKNMWRSGVKHDASKVMELTLLKKNTLVNGFQKIVEVEGEYLYPLLKSSDLANNRLLPRKFVIMTQRKIGEGTTVIQTAAPKLWQYLEKYSEKLEKRKSSIYKKQPRFSIFGVGEYSYKPYKIAISGFYKKINFCLLKSYKSKPIMVDDTCYLLGFESLKEAKKYLRILQSSLVTDYISSLVFWDAKRPINLDILKSIDLKKAFSKYKNYESKVLSRNK